MAQILAGKCQRGRSKNSFGKDCKFELQW
ncbi:unnamed protein product [Oikopleura dioica]|uniref:Uncharacterized protein n=1 Tax=Oikopleura dioica TaxID=34765 RepID=E4YU71_OIKDI|nr:unnamed protein product [Oikopleura dioica]